MKADGDLKRIERRAYLSFFRDGLWDICIGLFVLGWGVSIRTDMVAVMGGWYVVIYFIIWGLKKRLTYPRIGYVKLNERKAKLTARLMIIGVVMALGGVAMFILALPDYRPSWLIDYVPLIFSGMLSLVIAGIGWWMGAYRFLVHALFIFAAGAATAWFDVRWPDSYIVAGSVVTLIGIIVLLRFLIKYPVQREEQDVST